MTEDGKTHCCSPRDCKPIDPAAVREMPGGAFSTPSGPVGGRAVYQSEDGRTIICAWPDGRARCLFIDRGS